MRSAMLTAAAALLGLAALACGGDRAGPTTAGANESGSNVNRATDSCNRNTVPESVVPCTTCVANRARVFVQGNFDGWATKATGGGKVLRLIADHTWATYLTIADPSVLADTPGVLQLAFSDDDAWGADPGATVWTDPSASSPREAPWSGTAVAGAPGARTCVAIATPLATTYAITFRDDTLAYDVWFDRFDFDPCPPRATTEAP